MTTATTLEVVDLVIDGAARPARSGARAAVLDPATGAPLAEVAAAGPADVDDAVAAARAAQPAWSRLSPLQRAQHLFAVAAMVRRHGEDLARTESLDTGKPLAQARADVEVTAGYFEFYAGFADKFYGETMPLAGDSFALTFREPHGVTGHIIPWNYPLQIGCRTIVPSLMVGNACVVKPALEAPLSITRLGLLALEAGLPPGVLNVVPGDGGGAGAHLADHPGIDHLSFTGGLETGVLVMTAAARHVRPVTLELGGKSPSLVFVDADLERATAVLTKALIQNAGQTCSAGSRIVAVGSVHDELVDRLAKAFEEVTLGRGVDDPDMGPVISAAQRDRVLGYIDGALVAGCAVASGGSARGQIAAGQDLYYRLDVTGGADVQISATLPHAGSAQLFVRHGNLPGHDAAQIGQLAAKPLLVRIEHAAKHQLAPGVDEFDDHSGGKV